MKKIITVFLIFISFLSIPAKILADEIIEDELVKTYLKNTKTISYPKIQSVNDDFAESYLNVKNKKVEETSIIIDTFAINELMGKNSNIKPNKNYDYTSLERITILIKPEKTISSKKKFYEGMNVVFYTQNDVTINSVLIPKNSKISGRIETISKNQFRGVAGEIIVDNFYLSSNPEMKFFGTIDKTGANRSLWVTPVSIIFMPLFFSGFLFWNIKGGHAKIKKSKTYKIFYDNN